MRNKKISYFFFTAAAFLVPAMAITACGDDDTGVGPSTLLDGSTDGRSNADGTVAIPDSSKTETGTIPSIEAGSDSGPKDAGRDADASTTPDADASTAPDADASTAPDADASTPDADAATAPTPPENGLYKITSWTCTPPAGTAKDINAYAIGVGIAEIDLDIASAAGRLDVVYAGAPACTRSTAVGITYPQPGTIVTTTAPAYTCSATCAAAKCTATAGQPIVVDTYGFTRTATSFTGTRTMDAASVNGSLQSFAGCAVGDTEVATYTKK